MPTDISSITKPYKNISILYQEIYNKWRIVFVYLRQLSGYYGNIFLFVLPFMAPQRHIIHKWFKVHFFSFQKPHSAIADLLIGGSLQKLLYTHLLSTFKMNDLNSFKIIRIMFLILRHVKGIIKYL